MTPRAVGNRAFALLLAATLTTAGGVLSAQAVTGDDGPAEGQEIKKAPKGDKIGQHDRELLAEAGARASPRSP